MRSTFITTLGACLSICAADARAQVADPYEVTAPELSELDKTLGETFTISAGENLIKTRRFRQVLGAELLNAPGLPEKIGNFAHFSSGSLFYSIATKAAFKACSVDLFGQEWPSCLLDDDGDGQFDRFAVNNVAGAKPLLSKASYKKTDVRLPPVGGGLERSVIYQGGDTTTMRFSYREFANDLARPAFEEQLSIPITGPMPQQFAIKGIVFTALKMDGLGLQVRFERADPGKGWPAGQRP